MWELSQNQSIAKSAQGTLALSHSQSVDVKLNSQEGEPSLAAIQHKKIMKDLCETKKMTTEVLEKVKGQLYVVSGRPKGNKRKEMI